MVLKDQEESAESEPKNNSISKSAAAGQEEKEVQKEDTTAAAAEKENSSDGEADVIAAVGDDVDPAAVDGIQGGKAWEVSVENLDKVIGQLVVLVG